MGRSNNTKILKSILSLMMVFGAAQFASAETVSANGEAKIILPKLYLLDGMEIEAGHLGENKSCYTRVSDYAHMLAVDHTNHRELVATQARSRGVYRERVKLSQEESRRVLKMQDSMKSLEEMDSRYNFDSDFLIAMIDAHDFAIGVVQAAMIRDNDPGLRTFLQQTLVSLKMHHEEARQILTALEKNGDTGDDDGVQKCEGGHK